LSLKWIIVFKVDRVSGGTTAAAEDGRLIAAAEADCALRLSSSRADRFAGQTWLHLAGQEKPLA
jgi:hypothetical protein